MIEVDRLPAVVVHRARAAGPREPHDPVPQVALERHGAAVEAAAGSGHVERCGLEAGRRFGLRIRGMAELDLAPPVGQLLGDHPMAAGPAVMEAVGRAPGVGRPAAGDDESGEVLVPGAAGAVLAKARSGRPGRDVRPELAAPAPGEVDHLVGERGGRQHRRGQPGEADRTPRLQRRPQGQEPGRRIGVEPRRVGKTQRSVREDERQAAGIASGRLPLVPESRQERGPVAVAQDEPGLSGKAPRGLGADREVRMFVQHPARHVDARGPGQRRAVGPLGQRGAPVDDLGQAPFARSQHQGLAAVVQSPALHYFTAPRVRPAMKWRCIMKNMATGGRAATMEPALIRW